MEITFNEYTAAGGKITDEVTFIKIAEVADDYLNELEAQKIITAKKSDSHLKALVKMVDIDFDFMNGDTQVAKASETIGDYSYTLAAGSQDVLSKSLKTRYEKKFDVLRLYYYVVRGVL